MAVDVAQLLSFTVKNNASDLHLSGGVPPMIRVDGDIKRINMPALTHKDVNSMVYDIMNDKQRKDYEEFLETDFSFEIPKLARFRVNAFNQNRGSAAVFRIIPSEILSLDDLGAPAIFKDVCMYPRGICLVTGPTGSGKSTTLYTFLKELNTKETRIVTVEDPVENKLDGVVQIAVKPEIGLTFANGLRSILRGDPNIIMVGEMRDVETAEIAIQASLTGHLVLSTLHTNTAIGAMTRLIDMGVEPFLIASSLLGVMSQRLVRTLCTHCKEAVAPDELQFSQLDLDENAVDKSAVRIFEPTGCEQCDHTGFRGRIGIYELITIDESIRKMIHDAESEDVMLRSVRQHTPSLFQNGVERVLNGETSLSEIVRVTRDQ